MKTLGILAIVVGALLIGGVLVTAAIDKTNDSTIGSESCTPGQGCPIEGCTANNNCGLSACEATVGKPCGCGR